MRLLDLFCGAGGAAVGYHRAGFEVVGVDINPQPNYPFKLLWGDALEAFEQREWLASFDAIHASPPCQAFTRYRRRPGHVKDSPDLVAPTRALLEAAGLPWVIENVEGAPLIGPVRLCGSMFDPVMEIQRHRLFETNWNLQPHPNPCRHKLFGEPNQYPGGRSLINHGDSRALCRATMEIGRWNIPLEDQQAAMGIDWTTLKELSEAIPPAYTEWVGTQLMEVLNG